MESEKYPEIKASRVVGNSVASAVASVPVPGPTTATKKEHSSWIPLIGDLLPLVTRFVSLRFRNRTDEERQDVVQDTLISLLEKGSRRPSQIQGGLAGSIMYVCGIARHKMMYLIKKNAREVGVEDLSGLADKEAFDSNTPRLTPEGEIIDIEQASLRLSAVKKLIAVLNSREKDLVLTRMHRIPYTEIGRQLRIPSTNAMTYHSRAVEKMRRAASTLLTPEERKACGLL